MPTPLAIIEHSLEIRNLSKQTDISRCVPNLPVLTIAINCFLVGFNFVTRKLIGYESYWGLGYLSICGCLLMVEQVLPGLFKAKHDTVDSLMVT